jgi:hypothetical protein
MNLKTFNPESLEITMQTLARYFQRPHWRIYVFVAVLLALGLFAGTSPAQAAEATSCTTAPDPGNLLVTVRTCELWATTGTVTMPDSTVVNIWGYSDTAAGPAQLPGPTLVANEGETLVVILHNGLGETTSLAFRGFPVAPDTVGVGAGLDNSAAPYSLPNVQPGTYMYEAGLTTNGPRQVAMGMFGALIVRPALGAGYAYNDANTAFDTEAILVLSEIDPAFNASPATFDMTLYAPKYFLINGKAYPDTDPILAQGGDKVLIRYLDGGLQFHSMGLLGLGQTIIGKSGSALAHPYSVVNEIVSPGQTIEAMVTIPTTVSAATKYPLFEAIHMDNNGQSFGGMITFIAASPNTPPVAADDAYSVPDDEVLTVAAPGVLGNDTDADLDTLTASLVSGPSYGNLTFNLDGSFVYTPTTSFNAGGLALAGTDDYVSVPNAASLNPAAVTVEAWAKFDSLADRPHLVGKGTGGQGAYWLVVETDGTPRFFYTKSGETWSFVGGAAGDIVPGVWYHFAGVYDGTNATIYVNGVEKGTVVNAGTLATTDPNPVWFGRNSGGTDSFAGMLDEVRIWDVARTAGDIQAAMNTPLTGTEAGLVGYWQLDEGLGLTATDSTANGNDGALVNGPTWASAVAPAFNSDSFIYQADDAHGGTATANVTIAITQGNVAPIAVNDTYSVAQGVPFNAPAPGVLGNDTDANGDTVTASLVSGPSYGTLNLNADGSFDYTTGAGMVFNAGGLALAGTDDYVSVSNVASLNPAAVTVEAWAKFDSLADRPHLVGKGTGGQGAYWLVVETNGTPRFFYTKSGETWSAVNGAAGDIVPGVWYHFAGVYDGTNAKIYVNGVEKGTVVNAGTLETADPNPVWFGRNSGGTDSFAGMLDEVRIWNVARTAGDIQAAMNTPLTGTEAGLVGYWQLDEGLGLTAADSTANGNDGALINGPTWASAVAPAFNSDSFIYQADDGFGGVAQATVTITVTNAAPTVVITAPGDTAVAGMVTITAAATDDNAVAQVEFFVDAVSIGVDTDGLDGWSATWDTSTLANLTIHSLTAVATDVTARSTTSAAVNVTVGNTAPTVSITAPADLASVTGAVAITATAADDNAVTQVEFFADDGVTNTSLGVDINGLDGWSVTWDTSALADLSTYSLTAVASDAAAQTGASAAVSVTVSNAAPTVSITAPADLASVTGAVAITATAADDNAVTQVEFFADAVSIGVDTNGLDGWSVTWDTSALADLSAHTLTAVASDAAAQTGASAAVSVTVGNAAPSVSITAPDGLTPVTPSATTTISATAGDDNAVTQVEFFVDGVSIGLGTDMGGGVWSINWDTSGVATATTYSLTAVASDAATQATTSAAVSVTVQP